MTVATAPSYTDRFEKQITLSAPRSRVWRALTDVSQFNTWFGVAFTSPFAAGAKVSGQITIPNYDHMTMRIWVETIEPERLFSYRWHPHAMDKDVDYSSEHMTLVSFTLQDVEDGTLLTIVESGFDALPESRRAHAFMGISKGWPGQLEKIRKYLTAESERSTR